MVSDVGRQTARENESDELNSENTYSDPDKDTHHTVNTFANGLPASVLEEVVVALLAWAAAWWDWSEAVVRGRVNSTALEA